jgi:hypothetical protein
MLERERRRVDDVETPSPRHNPPVVIQRSLHVGAVNDPAELEADRLAHGFAGSAELPRSAPPQLGALGAAGGDVPGDLARRVDTLRSGGRAIDDRVRAPLEKYFNTDLSAVRIHASGADAQVSRAMGARAFTSGNDIFFDRGMYRPSEAGGRRLLAHEVTHVVQQGAGRIVRSTIRRSFALKESSTDEYVDSKIPFATMKASGTVTTAGTEYFIF